jgi:molybdopterin-guanine dinucleotide biosynthesis protein B
VLGTSVGQVVIISSRESALFWNRPLSLEEIIPHLEADIVLVEGFKAQRSWPKIACLRGQPDDGDLFDGLVICAVGPGELLDELAVPALDDAGIPLLGRDEVSRIADLVERQVQVTR